MASINVFRALAPVALASVLSACGNGPKPVAPSGSAAYAIIPAEEPGAIAPEYRIGPRDILSLKVFREDDFDDKNIEVGADGKISVPLIGLVEAEGRTAHELGQVIARRLNTSFLVNPQVSVNVVTAATQRLIIDGEVQKPGIFPIRGNSTLVEAMALAGGTTEFAKLDQVLVFRTIDGQPSVARFNLADIRAGLAPDPQLLGNDTVVVGYSVASRRMKNIMQVVPAAAGIFVSLLNNNIP